VTRPDDRGDRSSSFLSYRRFRQPLFDFASSTVAVIRRNDQHPWSRPTPSGFGEPQSVATKSFVVR